MREIEIKRLLIKYRNLLEKLKSSGVIRSGKVVGDYGEYIAAKKLNLKLANSSVNKGYDAIDKYKRKYEIKTRKATAKNNPTIFPINKAQIEVVDFLVYVEFDNDWNVAKMLKIPTDRVKANKYNRVIVNHELVKKFSIL